MSENRPPQAVDKTMGYFEKREKQYELDGGKLSAHAMYPKNALVELTNGCNHACIFCKNTNQARRVGNLKLETFEKFIGEAVALGLTEIGLYATGEPFMTKNLEEYIAVAKKQGVARVYLTSNGALASLDRVISCYDAGLSSIKFSINASSQAEYALVHGRDDFDTVLNNLNNIYEWRSKTGAKLQLLCSCVMIPALKDLEANHRAIFGKYFEDIHYVKSSSQGGQAFELIDQYGLTMESVFSNLSNPVDPSDVKPCQMIWNRYHLTAEGYLTACCVDYELDLVYGDLKSTTLADLWNNEVVKKLRTAHLDKDLGGLLCDQCLHNRPAPYNPLSDVAKKTKSDSAMRSASARHLDRIRIASARP